MSCHSESSVAGSEESLSTPTTDRDPSIVAKLLRDDKYKRQNLITELFASIKKIIHFIWSLEAKKKFAKVLDEFKPDVVHLHNIYHHLTPSILAVAKKRKIPIVMTVHDYSLINHNYLLFDHNQICEKTGLSSLKNKCIGNSYFKTLISLTKFFVQQKTKAFQNNIDLFICPTEFVREKMIVKGFGEKKVVVLGLPVETIIPNPSQGEESLSNRRSIDGTEIPQSLRRSFGMTNQSLEMTPYSPPPTPYILFAGRLSPEKGIDLLLKIAERLPEINFVIAGDGPFIEHITEHKNNGTQKHNNNLTLLGFLLRSQLRQVMQNAHLVVVPSLCYETANLVLLEAMSLGKTVVASKLGGMRNLITNKKDGILVPLISNDLDKTAEMWIEEIKKIFSNEELLTKIGQEAIKTIQTRHDPEEHYQELEKIYLSFG